uniref:Uncharacterized protein n=1 Tax=Laticauda laticaudata TaxID=8630 RepID=A0A8C5RVF0_LATLA
MTDEWPNNELQSDKCSTLGKTRWTGCLGSKQRTPSASLREMQSPGLLLPPCAIKKSTETPQIWWQQPKGKEEGPLAGPPKRGFWGSFRVFFIICGLKRTSE